MAADTKHMLRHQLNFTLYNLPATTVRIDFPSAAGAETMMWTSMPTIQLGASYTNTPVVINNLFIQPRRIEFEIASPPSQLPIALQIESGSQFVFGWLLVPESVQTVIATVAQRIRIVGPGYWALPLWQPPESPEPVSKPTETPAPGKPAAKPVAEGSKA